MTVICGRLRRIDFTVWVLKIPECEPRRQARNVLTQRALHRQGCARLADPASAVASIAACAADFVAWKTALLPSNDLARGMKTAIAAIGATPHATTKPSEFLSTRLSQRPRPPASRSRIPICLLAGCFLPLLGWSSWAIALSTARRAHSLDRLSRRLIAVQTFMASLLGILGIDGGHLRRSDG